LPILASFPSPAGILPGRDLRTAECAPPLTAAHVVGRPGTRQRFWTRNTRKPELHYLKTGSGKFVKDMMASGGRPDRTEAAAVAGRAPLTKREREILGALAAGMSGAQIAEKLVLSPETVRTHVRNAMAKLGASTRSQAVALALQHQEISADAAPPAAAQPRPGGALRAASDPAAALSSMLDGLVSLYDLDGGAVYMIGEDGLSLERAAEAEATAAGLELPAEVALGDGALGRVALERRAQLLQGPVGDSSGRGALIAAPMIGGGRLIGVIALTARLSRPIGRSELLLLQAFANRVGEVVLAGSDVDRRLERAMQRFRASWSGAPPVA
jgi:DNA-binding CsgD family transcriptional regulator